MAFHIAQMPLTLTWLLRETRKRPARLRGSCACRANTPHAYVALARDAQMPRTATWLLRKSRKCPARLRGSCGSRANAPHGYVALAEVAQMARTATWLLRKSRKCLARLRGSCGSIANKKPPLHNGVRASFSLLFRVSIFATKVHIIIIYSTIGAINLLKSEGTAVKSPSSAPKTNERIAPRFRCYPPNVGVTLYLCRYHATLPGS